MKVDAMDSSKMRKLLISTGIGGVAGFLVAFTLIRTVDSGLLGAIDTSRSIAALVASLYLLCGAFVGIGLLNPRLGEKFLNVEDADELREQMTMLRYSVFTIISIGVCLFMLALAAPAGPVPVEIAVAVIAALMIACIFTSRRQMAVVDELIKSVSRESTSTAFYTLFVVGGGWAMLAHLGYVAGPAALDWVTMFAVVMLFGAFWACGRRGLLFPR